MPVELQIIRADQSRQVDALRVLFAHFSPEEQTARLEDTLLAVTRGTLNLDQLWLAEWNGEPVGAALVMRQADGVSLVWPPVITFPSETVAIRDQLMAAICTALDDPQVKFGQCLLTAEESSDAAWLADYGFQCTADLFFLARSLEEQPDLQSCDLELSSEAFSDDENADRFANVIERTYSGSLDCPDLNGTRTGIEALAGHRLSGEFHPRGWRLYRTNNVDAAVLLLNEHPDQDAVELTYFGVVPEFRGRGIGRQLLADAMQSGRDWQRAAIFLAVDARNTFANELYADAGFQEVARRAVWLRFPRAAARE